MTAFVCSRCGGGQVTVSPGRPSLDPRYAVGLCARCSQDPDQPGELSPAKAQQLVREQDWDPATLADRQRRNRERRIVRRPSEQNQEERARILERYRAEARDRGMPA